MPKPRVSLRRAPADSQTPAPGTVEGFVGAGRPDPEGFALQVIRIAVMRIDGDTQVRVDLDEPTVAAYALLYAEGQDLDPPCLFFDGVHHWIGDGFHRRFAAERARRQELLCRVKPGTQRDARWYALGANRRHGKAMTPEDKRKAVQMALADPEWRTQANTVIAMHTGTSHTFVAQLRQKLCQEEVTPRQGRDGRVRRVRQHATLQVDRCEHTPEKILDRGGSNPNPEPRPAGMTQQERIDTLLVTLRVHLGQAPVAMRRAMLDALEIELATQRQALDEPPPGARETLRRLAQVSS